MAIAQVGNASYVVNSAATTSIAFSGMTAGAGNVQVVYLLLDATGVSITPPTGYNSVVVDNTTSGHGSTIGLYFANSSLVAAPSFSFTSRINAGICIEFSGVPTTGTIDGTDVFSDVGVNQTGGVAFTCPAVTPTQANERFLFFSSRWDTVNVTTPPAGYTEVAPTGGAGGNVSGAVPALRAYYLDNPGLSSQQPSILWENNGLAGTQGAYLTIEQATTGGSAGAVASWPPPTLTKGALPAVRQRGKMRFDPRKAGLAGGILPGKPSTAGPGSFFSTLTGAASFTGPSSSAVLTGPVGKNLIAASLGYTGTIQKLTTDTEIGGVTFTSTPTVVGFAYNSSGSTLSLGVTGLPALGGDIQIACVSVYGDGAQVITPPANFTLIASGNWGGAANGWIATYKATTSLVSNPSFSVSESNSMAVEIIEVDGSVSVDVSSSVGTVNTLTSISSSVTTTYPNDLVLFFASKYANDNSIAVTTPPSGYTEIGSGTVSTFVGGRVYKKLAGNNSVENPSLVWNGVSGFPSAGAYVALTQATQPLVTKASKMLTAVGSFTGPTATALTGLVSKFFSGASSFSGAIQKSIITGVLIVVASILSFAGTKGTTKTSRLQTAAVSFTGAIRRSNAKLLTAIESFTGAAGRSTSTSRTGTQGFTGSAQRQTGKVFAGGQSFAGAFLHTIAKLVTGVLSFSGASQRSIARAIAGVLTSNGIASRGTSTIRTAVASFVGTPQKQTSTIRTAIASFAGVSQKTRGGSYTGVLAFTGSARPGISFGKALAGVLSFVGAVQRATATMRTGAVATVGSVQKFTGHAVPNAVLSFAGTAKRATSTVRTGAVSFTGATKSAASKFVSGVLSFAGAVNRGASHAFSGVASFVGSGVPHAIAHMLTGTQGFTGTIKRSTVHTPFTGAVSFAGTFARQARKFFAGVLNFTGTFVIQGATQQFLTAALSFSGSAKKYTAHKLSGVLSFVGLSSSRNLMTFIAHFNFSTSFVYVFTGYELNVNLTAALSFTGNLFDAMWSNLTFAGQVSRNILLHSFTATLNLSPVFYRGKGFFASITPIGSVKRAIITTVFNGIAYFNGYLFNGQFRAVVAMYGVVQRQFPRTFVASVGSSAVINKLRTAYQIYFSSVQLAGSRVGLAIRHALTSGLSFDELSIDFETIFDGVHQVIYYGIHAYLNFNTALSKASPRFLSGVLNLTPLFIRIPHHTRAVFNFFSSVSMLAIHDVLHTAYVNPTAALNFTNTMRRSMTRALPSALSFTTLMRRDIMHSLAALINWITDLNRGTTRSFVASVSSSGDYTAFRKAFGILAASISFVGVFKKTTPRIFNATATFNTQSLRVTNRAFAAALSFVGTISKSSARAYTAVLTSSGVAQRAMYKVYAGILQPTAQAKATANKALTGGIAFSPATAHSMAKLLFGTVSFSGIPAHLYSLRIFTAAISFATSSMRGPGPHSFTGSLNVGGTIHRDTARVIAGTLGFVGAAISKTSFHAVFISTLDLDFTTVFLRSLTKDVSASLSSSGTGRRATGRGLSGALNSAGVVGRSMTRGMSAALLPSATLGQQSVFLRLFTGQVSPAGVVRRATSRAFQATESFVGSITKAAYVINQGSLYVSGNIIKSAYGRFTAAVSFSGETLRTLAEIFTASLSFSSAFHAYESTINFIAAVSLSGAITQRNITRSIVASLTENALFSTSFNYTSKSYDQTENAILAFNTTMRRDIRHAFAGVLTAAGAIQRYVPRVFIGILSSSGQTKGQINKLFSGMVVFATASVRTVSKSLSATQQFAGLFSETRAALKVFTAFVGFAGQTNKTVTKITQASLALAGLTAAQFGHSFVAFVNLTGASKAQPGRMLTASLALSSNWAYGVGRRMVGSISFSTDLQKPLLRFFMGALSLGGTQRRAISTSEASSLGFTGLHRKSGVQALVGVLTSTGVTSKGLLRGITGSLGSVGGLRELATKTLQGTISPSGGIRRATSYVLAALLRFTTRMVNAPNFVSNPTWIRGQSTLHDTIIAYSPIDPIISLASGVQDHILLQSTVTEEMQ